MKRGHLEALSIDGRILYCIIKRMGGHGVDSCGSGQGQVVEF
jgi:hypothetical protein